MQQFHKFITWRLCVSQDVSGAAHYQELTTALTASGFTLKLEGNGVVGRGLVGYEESANPRPTTLLPPRTKVQPEAVNVVVSSWWWAWRRPKHVERHINVK
jgi:hypothetical protein